MKDQSRTVVDEALTLPFEQGLSRREMLGLATLAAAALATGCASGSGGVSIEGGERVEALFDRVESLLRSGLSPAESRTIEQIGRRAFPAGQGGRDESLLAGALYLEAARRLSGRGGGNGATVGAAEVSDTQLRRALGDPAVSERLTEQHFQAMVDQARDLAGRSRDARCQLEAASQRSRRRVTCECNLGACWKCIVVIVVIVIVILL